MGNHEADVREEIIVEAAQVAERSHSAGALPPPDVADLLRAYYRHVSAADLAQREPVDVYGAALSHHRLAADRPAGTAAVHVFTPTVEEHGWSCGHTVVEVVTDDMPFLVDSVTMELSRQDRAIHLVVHPQLLVRRTAAGALQAVGDGPVNESWIHVEIDRETGYEEVKAIESGLRRVLRDVRGAVEDWPQMRERARAIVDQLGTTPPPGLAPAEVDEARELLSWLGDDHFTFLGYREYTLVRHADGDSLRVVPGSGLGVLRPEGAESQSFSQLPADVRARARERSLLILTKANSRATVHRSAYLDYVGVKTFDDQGEVTGERRFLGLFTSVTYSESVHRIPVLRRKAHEVLDRSGFEPDSHSGKALVDIIENYPRNELFQVSVEELLETATAILHLQERRQLRVFVRRDAYGRFVSFLVYLPRDRFMTQVRLRLQDILLETYGGQTIDFTLQFSESVLARLHFVVRLAQGATIPDVEVAELEHRLAAATRNWSDDFADALVEQVGESRASGLRRDYGQAFPASYREDFTARTAVADLTRLVKLDPAGDLAMSLYEPVDAGPTERRFKIYRTGTALSLAQVLPRLSQMGVEVIDERPYEIEAGDGSRAWIYDFGLLYDGSAAGAPRELPENVRELFQDAFGAVWSGACESDGFNALVLRAGLSWRQVSVLRGYAKYLRQVRATFSQSYIEDALVANVGIARLLLALFEARLDPDRSGDLAAREARSTEIIERIESALEDVASLDQDRIVRSLLALIRTTLRTNYFRPDPAGEPRPYLSFKLDAAANPDLPPPRPLYEIWVYAPRVEGVHLRFGPVARGGLRWSDRREDFRTEVLGLVKAQMVKNAVIVPVGAKGGFFCKQLPDPIADREGWLAEGLACYQTFIRGLLDITDNLDGEVVRPRDVVCHDGDDAYLVVAADKGTAAFSDVANAVAREYGYWLDDAFASGGSTGYDHKALGITARGAWETVKRHFREMGRDCQAEDFTCVGIGDMSGDVFGNGMLASEHTRLVAAFDHRHVFCDPDPDPVTSYAERRRLFELPRSSWGDYDTALISAGGGVFRRSAKSVPVSEPLRAALGIDDAVTRLTPNELIHAILEAPVDLLWNGGIGTYVKASTESHADAGDKTNDGVRVDGSQLRCRCVGEGGNLGCTQLGRIEYATGGGRITTDFLDNSAGVDTSDHEVNIKVLLNAVVSDGDLTTKHRNELLARMSDEVADLVLRDNYDQNVAVQTTLAIGPAMLHVHADWIRRLERAGKLDRGLEFLPSSRQLRERRAAGRGLTSPETCVLLAYTKIVLAEDLLSSDLPEDPYLRHQLVDYFPTPMRDRFDDRMDDHPLHREIVTTQVVNQLVNMAGITFFHRLSQETGATGAELARAHAVGRAIFGVDEIWQCVEELDNRLEAAVQSRLRLQARTIAERAARWLVQNRRPPIDIEASIDSFGAGFARLVTALPDVLCGRERALFEAERDDFVRCGVEEELATRVAALAPAYGGFGIVEAAASSGEDLLDVARVHFALGERLELGRLLERILALSRNDRWEATARAALRDDLHAVHAQLTRSVLAVSEPGEVAADRVRRWESVREDTLVDQTRGMVGELVEGDTGAMADLARLSVGLRVVRRLLPTPG